MSIEAVCRSDNFIDTVIQTEGTDRVTWVIEDGTKVNLRFGDEIVILITLNDSEAAQALIASLPYTIQCE